MANPLQTARYELDVLRRQRIEITSRIEALEAAIKILEPVYGNLTAYPANLYLSDLADLGLTDRVRKILRGSFPQMLNPVQIRDSIVEAGFVDSTRSNFLAEIHGVLRRLTERGEVEAAEQDGKRVYQLAQPKL